MVQGSALPVERLFAYLSEHENLGPTFGARVTRVRDGHETRNGVGSVRQVKVGPLPAFEETVTGFELGEYVQYRITRGLPLKDHVGTLRFAPTATGSTVTWVIEFGAPPVVGPLAAAALRRRITAGLRTVDSRA